MIRYSWKGVLIATKYSGNEIISAIKALSPKAKPKNRRDPVYKYQQMESIKGNSFLLREWDLILNQHKYSTYNICMYLYLASFRSYEAYLLTGDKTLDIRYSNVCRKKLEDNPLLKLENFQIKFKYEEL